MRSGRSWISLVTLSASVVCLTACGPGVVLIHPGEPVQLAEDVKARVYVTLPDGSREKSRNRVSIPHGWWTLPDYGD